MNMKLKSSGSQATALAPQNNLFGAASRGDRKDNFSLGYVEEERRQVGKINVAQTDKSRVKG